MINEKLKQIIRDYVEDAISDEKREYKMPVQEALKQACIDMPEVRLKKARKALTWLIVLKYSPAFNAWMYENPEALADLLSNVPDFDSILRAMRDLQNEKELFTEKEAKKVLQSESLF